MPLAIPVTMPAFSRLPHLPPLILSKGKGSERARENTRRVSERERGERGISGGRGGEGAREKGLEGR